MTTGMFPLGRGSINAQRVRLSHNHAAIRHMRVSQAQLCGGVTLAVRDNDLPPLQAYEDWFCQVSKGTTFMDARKLRRLAQMRRNGCTNQEIANVIGGSAHSASVWFGRLRADLR